MIDKEGRVIDYVRISLTDKCNLRCVYCMPEEGVEYIPHEQILTFDEIVRICRCLAELGFKKVKLTGGEPLVRKNCATLVREIKAIPGIEKVTLTTNGILLKEQMKDLAEAGLDAVNISLDTLDPELFAKITRCHRLEDVLAGIHEALKYPEIPTKINSVPMGQNPENFIKLAEIAKNNKVHVRFIEMMPIGYGKQFTFQGEEDIIKILEAKYGKMIPANGYFGNGPGHYYTIEGFKGKIGFISAMTHKFCSQCNRVRMTCEGFMKACLQYQDGTDLREIMRNGCTDEELKEAMTKVILNKPECHNFQEKENDEFETRGMSQIGG